MSSGDGGWHPPDGVVQGTKMEATLLLMLSLGSYTPSCPLPIPVVEEVVSICPGLRGETTDLTSL